MDFTHYNVPGKFLAKNKTVFTELGSHCIFPLSKTEDIYEKKGNFATIEDLKEKSKKEVLAIPKCAFQMCFEYWKKKAGISVLYLEGTR